MTRPGSEPGLSDHWRTLYPLGQWAGDSSNIVLDKKEPFFNITSNLNKTSMA